MPRLRFTVWPVFGVQKHLTGGGSSPDGLAATLVQAPRSRALGLPAGRPSPTPPD